MKIKYKDFLKVTVGNPDSYSFYEMELNSSTIFGLGFLDILNRFTSKVGIHLNVEEINLPSNYTTWSFLAEINRMMIDKMYLGDSKGIYVYADYYGKLGEELEIEI